MKKNLVYYSVGNSSEYSELLKLSIESIDNSNHGYHDILVITDLKFYNENLINYCRPNLYYYIVDDIKKNDEICFNKYVVFGWEKIDNYDKILYLDSDILVNYNLTILFQKCIEKNKLHVVVEDYSIYNHQRIHFGSCNYDEKELNYFRDNKIYTFNAGQFLTHNNIVMRNHFYNLCEIINTNDGSFYSDQSMVNFYFNRLNLTNCTSFFKEVDLVYVVNENIEHITDFDSKIFHFLGNTYDGSSKIYKIKQFYENNIKPKKIRKRALIGGGGHTREVLRHLDCDIKIFVDDQFYENKKGYYKLSDFDPELYEIMVCVGDPSLRERIVNKLPENTLYFTFIHPTALILDENIKIGKGSFIGPYSIITTNVEIGNHSILNSNNRVGHDTVCGDFLSMMPGSIISGNCKLGDRIFLGSNSSIREKVFICSDVIVGLNSGVISNINNSGTYVGNPAQKK